MLTPAATPPSKGAQTCGVEVQVGDPVRVAIAVGVEVADPVGVEVGVKVKVIVAVQEQKGVKVLVGDPVTVEVTVDVGVGVKVLEPVSVRVAVVVEVADPVGVGVSVPAVFVGVEVKVEVKPMGLLGRLMPLLQEGRNTNPPTMNKITTTNERCFITSSR